FEVDDLRMVFNSIESTSKIVRTLDSITDLSINFLYDECLIEHFCQYFPMVKSLQVSYFEIKKVSQWQGSLAWCNSGIALLPLLCCPTNPSFEFISGKPQCSY